MAPRINQLSTHTLRRDTSIYLRWQESTSRAVVTLCHDSGSLLSVCVDPHRYTYLGKNVVCVCGGAIYGWHREFAPL